MKIISLEIRKINIEKFFPRENKLELNIFFNDGTDKEIFKIVDVSDSKDAAEDILNEIRKIERTIHKDILGEIINIVIKDEDKLINAIAEFIKQARDKVGQIKSKRDAEGYLDLIRDLKGIKVEF